MLKITQVTQNDLSELESLFSTDVVGEKCWCMWFIRPVKEFHAAGASGNKGELTKLIQAGDYPVGLLAFEGEEPVGWCAVGPRNRYVRAIKTPTYKGRDPGEDSDVWLVPCFFVRPNQRGHAVTRALSEEAVNLARANEAKAIEGFPYSGSGRRSRDTQVGFESLFAALGFLVIREPSANRVMMRRELDR